jgi:VWFA-related protein
MKKFLYSGIFVFVFSLVSIPAQTPSPTATPKPAEDEEDVVKISTTLIQIDVTATDRDGKVVTDLKPEDFEVYENGNKQSITNFSFVSAASGVKPVQPEKPINKNDPISPLPPVKIQPGQVRRTIALVIDDLGLSWESIYFVRRALKKFVDEQMQPNDLVAIVRTGSGAGAAQQFTSDKNRLYAVIEAIKWNSIGRSGISAFAPVEPSRLEMQGQDNKEAIKEDNERTRLANNFREDIFSVGTLGAINFIVNGMKELPGRKSIMLFSDGFVICTQDDPSRCERLKDSFQALTDLCNRASVSIYSFDARGLQSPGMSAADNMSALDREQSQERMSQRSADLSDKQEGLASLSEETGGRAFFNNNDFNKGLEKALEDQKGFYLLGYLPDSDTFDAPTRRFNKLEVKVTRPGVDVRYRSGFFGITDDKRIPAANKTQQLQTALISPFTVNGINLTLNTLFGNDAKLGSFVHSFLHIKTKDLKFTDGPDGTHKTTFEVLAMSFGVNGNPVDRIAGNYTLTLKGDSYKKVLEEGFVYEFMFPVKKPGAYQMRVALRDSATSKVGSANQFIEVPDIKKDHLTLSGIVLENLTEQQWKDLTLKTSMPETASVRGTNPLADTSLRRFKRGTVLRYSVEIYNAKLGKGQKMQLQTQIRVFRDGKILQSSEPKPLDLEGQPDPNKLYFPGALSLGENMEPGDYVLQTIVTDTLAKEKRKIATQWIQFEIIQ